LNIGNIPYFVNGLGGAENVYTSFRNPPLAGSAVHYSSDFGAMLVDANDTRAQFQFITRGGTVIVAGWIWTQAVSGIGRAPGRSCGGVGRRT